MQEIALFSGKIYTAGRNFTRPPVATNLNSIINIITNLPCHSSLSQNDPFYRTQMCLKQSDCQNSRNNFANLLKLSSKLPTWIIIVEDGDLHRVLWADLQVAVVHLRIEANLHHHRRCHSHIS